MPDVGQIAANERQVVPFVETADRPHAARGVGVVEAATECVGRIGRISDHAAFAQNAAARRISRGCGCVGCRVSNCAMRGSTGRFPGQILLFDI